MLTDHQAIEIYWRKILRLTADQSERESRLTVISLRRESESLAKQFGLTIRAVQDVWKRRSWAHATYHLWKHDIHDVFEQRYSAAEVRDQS